MKHFILSIEIKKNPVQEIGPVIIFWRARSVSLRRGCAGRPCYGSVFSPCIDKYQRRAQNSVQRKPVHYIELERSEQLMKIASITPITHNPTCTRNPTYTRLEHSKVWFAKRTKLFELERSVAERAVDENCVDYPYYP